MRFPLNPMVAAIARTLGPLPGYDPQWRRDYYDATRAALRLIARDAAAPPR